MKYCRQTYLALLLLTLLGYFSVFADNTEILEIDYPDNLTLIKRNVWGWQPIRSPHKTHTINYITIHHGGTKFHPDKEPENYLRNLQTWSRSEKKWVDIPYHYMIDLSGNIFEARPVNIPGDTNTEYDPTSHLLIAIMGNYEIQTLSEEQLASTVDLIKFLSKRFNVATEDIKTHRDYSTKTVCPGKNIYQYFENGTLKQMLSDNQ